MMAKTAEDGVTDHPLKRLLDELLASPATGSCITATRFFPPRPARWAPFPPDLDSRIADALRRRGIQEPYAHQAQAWRAARRRR